MSILQIKNLLLKSFRHTPVLAPGAVLGENAEKMSFSQRSQWALWLGKGLLMPEVKRRNGFCSFSERKSRNETL